MSCIIVLLREGSTSTPTSKQYDKESNESLILLRKILKALLSSPLVTKKKKKKKIKIKKKKK